MTILSDIMNGIVFVDADGQVSLINPVAEELLETKAFQAMGHRLTDVVPGCVELTRSIIDDHEKVSGDEEITRTIEVPRGEHEVNYVEINTSRVFAWDHKPAGILTVLRDITSEYKHDQLRNQYLSIVAHELRTPLTGIKTFSTLMAKGSLGELSELQDQAVQSIREQSIRLEHQIDKLINLGNIDAKDYAQDPEVLPVRELLAASVAPFEQVAKDSGLEIEVISDGVGNAAVSADRTDIKRVLKSLVENAAKFTTGPGKVTVAAQVIDDRVIFRVSDTGVGVDRRYHKRIFEKFFQVEDPLTRHHGGAGLGLFVAQGIIEAHDSRIEIESELGSGASFRFTLPLFDELVRDPVSSGEVSAS